MNDLHELALRQVDANPQPSDDTRLRQMYPDLEAAIEAHLGTTDPAYAPMLPPHLQHVLPDEHAKAQATGLWIPASVANEYGLHIVYRPAESAGAFTGGGMKWVHHITVSSWWQVDAMADVLVAKRACPQLLVGGRRGVANPILYQFMPLNAAGRALEHVFAPPTNTANAIQLEICGDVRDVPNWDDWHLYKALANVIRATNEVLPRNVPWNLARSFANTTRFGAQEFVDIAGHCGHMHVPGNTHFDPTTSFMGSTIMWNLQNMPDDGWPMFGSLDIDRIR